MKEDNKKEDTTRTISQKRLYCRSAVQAASRRGEKIIQDPTTASLHITGPVLFKPLFCQMCGKRTPSKTLHAHHHHGYEEPLAVWWVCSKCHGKITAYERAATCMCLPSTAGLARFISDRRTELQQSV